MCLVALAPARSAGLALACSVSLMPARLDFLAPACSVSLAACIMYLGLGVADVEADGSKVEGVAEEKTATVNNTIVRPLEMY